MLNNPKDIARRVVEWGFLPFFKGEIEGFSIEECIAPEHWFPDGEDAEGVWEWKNEIILDADCAYGKFYQGKACFVSMEWFPHLVNWRRSGAKLTADEQLLRSTVEASGSLLSRDLKKLCGYTAPPRRRVANPIERMALRDEPAPKPQPQRKGFDSALTRLQMSCALLTADFEYNYTRDGRRYGWSVARYCTPEDYFGAERLVVDCSPDESRQRMMSHLAQVLPMASTSQLARIVG